MPSATSDAGDTRAEVTALLHEWACGDRRALDGVVSIVYEELRRVARHRLRLERSDHTLGTTALVNESYLRLADIRRAGFESRAHFLAMASRAMRRVLVDHARRRGAEKRGGDGSDVPLEDAPQLAAGDVRRFLDLEQALSALREIDERQASVVEHHYFGGLTFDEIADVLGVSRSTVKRDMRFARAWLAAELGAP